MFKYSLQLPCFANYAALVTIFENDGLKYLLENIFFIYGILLRLDVVFAGRPEPAGTSCQWLSGDERGGSSAQFKFDQDGCW